MAKTRLAYFLILASLSITHICKADNLVLTFNGQSTSSDSYLISASRDITYTTDNGNSGEIRAGANKRLWLPGKVSKVAYTFSDPTAITALDLSYPDEASGIGVKLTDVTVIGLDDLKDLKLDLNMLTWPIGGELPETCKVTYGSQNTVSFDIMYGNRINLGRYNTAGWTASWTYTNNQQPVPTSYYTQLPDGTYQFLQNLSSGVTLTLAHPSGLVLTTQPIMFNKMVYELLKLSTDGRGTGTEISVSSNKNITEQFVIGYDGTYFENSTYNLTLDIPSLKYNARDLTIEANIPDVITSLKLNNLGIRELEIGEKVKDLNYIDLTGNSLVPSAIPSILKNCQNVILGLQNPFTVPISQNGFSFDLKDQINAGAVVEWVDQYNNPVPSSKYTENNGIFSFTESVGNIRARLTISDFPDYEIYSEPIDINFQYEPLAVITWADDSETPSMIGIVANQDISLQVNAVEYKLSENMYSDIRLGSNSGTASLFSTGNNSISRISFAGIGLYGLDLGGNLGNLKELDLRGNLFTPFKLPKGIPSDCKVEWGETQMVNIEPYISGNNGIDMIDFSDFEIEWFKYPSAELLETNMYSERGGFYLFENVGQIYGELTSDIYPGLIFKTSVVDFSGAFMPVFDFTCQNGPENSAIINLTGQCRLEINGIADTEYSSGKRNINFADDSKGSNSNSVYTLRANFPEMISEITLSGIGIKSISFSSELSSLEKIDLSHNSLHFGTFPRNLDCEVTLDDQKPVELRIDEDGTIHFPDFSDCRDIHMLDADGNLLPETYYEIHPSRNSLQLKSNITNAIIVFTDHPDFGGVKIVSAPITFASTGIDAISESSGYSIAGNVITISDSNLIIYLYHTNGTLATILKGNGAHKVRNGLYLLTIPGRKAVKIKL